MVYPNFHNSVMGCYYIYLIITGMNHISQTTIKPKSIVITKPYQCESVKNLNVVLRILCHFIKLRKKVSRAIALLESMRGLHSELVFPSPRAQVPVSDTTLTMFCVEPKRPAPPKAGMPPPTVFVPAFGTGAVNRGMPETWLSGP